MSRTLITNALTGVKDFFQRFAVVLSDGSILDGESGTADVKATNLTSTASSNPSQNRLITGLEADTIKYAEWPDGDIRILTFVLQSETLGTALGDGRFAKVAIDPSSGAIATLMLADPADSSSNCNFIEVHPGEPVTIELASPLANDPQGNGSQGAIAVLLNDDDTNTKTARLWIGAAS